MMIISQKLGNREAARFHAAVFKDLKDDPQMTSLAGAFLEKNRNVGNESLPFHVHELALFQPKAERTGYLYFFE